MYDDAGGFHQILRRRGTLPDFARLYNWGSDAYDKRLYQYALHDLSRKATFCTDSRRQKDDASAAIVKHALRETSEWSGVKLVGNQQQMANLQLIDHREGESQRQQLASSVQHRHTKEKKSNVCSLIYHRRP